MSYRLKVAAALITSLTLANVTSAAAAECAKGVSATGRAANPMNYDPPKHYDMETLAKARAIAAWSAAIRSSCPGFSPSWKLSRNRDVFCEGYAGGLSCEATAAPKSG